MTSVWVDVSSTELKTALCGALARIGIDPQESPKTPPDVVLREAGNLDEPSENGNDATAVIRLWRTNRNDRSTNPFVSRGTRHVLGSTNVIDDAELRSTLQHLTV